MFIAIRNSPNVFDVQEVQHDGWRILAYNLKLPLRGGDGEFEYVPSFVALKGGKVEAGTCRLAAAKRYLDTLAIRVDKSPLITKAYAGQSQCSY